MKKQKGFMLVEIVIAIMVILAIGGILGGIANSIFHFSETEKVVNKQFHINSFLNSGIGWCKQNGEGTRDLSEILDGEVYTISEECLFINGNLYKVIVQVCDSNSNCWIEEGYVAN